MWYMLIAVIICVVWDKAGKPRPRREVDVYANTKELLLCVWQLTLFTFIYTSTPHLLDALVESEFKFSALVPPFLPCLGFIVGRFFVFVALYSFLRLLAYAIELLFSLPEPYRDDHE